MNGAEDFAARLRKLEGHVQALQHLAAVTASPAVLRRLLDLITR